MLIIIKEEYEYLNSYFNIKIENILKLHLNIDSQYYFRLIKILMLILILTSYI